MAAVDPAELLLATSRLDVPSTWRPSDREGYAALNADPEVMRMLGRPLTAQESDDLADYGESVRAEGLGLLPVIRRSDGEFLGMCGLHHMRWYPDDVEVGWRFSRTAWGHGYATETAVAWLEHAFGTVGLERVVSITRPDNARSLGVMHRLGMTELLREVNVDRDGSEVPTIVHVLDRSTWASGLRPGCGCLAVNP